MTENEICYSYRTAKNKAEQIQVLSQLCGISELQIISILVKNGRELPQRVVDRLYKRLDALDEKILEKEREYKAIVAALKGEG